MERTGGALAPAGAAAGITIISDFDRMPFEQAMNTIYAKTVTDPGLRELIERIRKIQ